jgi:hypothetical protein
MGEQLFSGVNAQKNDAEEKKAECGLRGHPAGLLGEDVGGEYRVDPEGPSGAVFIEDGSSEEDDNDSKEAADEGKTEGQLWVVEG